MKHLRLKRISDGCPTQWRGVSELGESVYIRYRFGNLDVIIKGQHADSRPFGEEFLGIMSDAQLVGMLKDKYVLSFDWSEPTPTVTEEYLRIETQCILKDGGSESYWIVRGDDIVKATPELIDGILSDVHKFHRALNTLHCELMKGRYDHMTDQDLFDQYNQFKDPRAVLEMMRRMEMRRKISLGIEDEDEDN